MSYRTYISDLALEVGDLSKATFAPSDEVLFRQWLRKYIATHDETCQKYGGDIDLMLDWDFTYDIGRHLTGLSVDFPWDDTYVPYFFLTELAGTSRFFRERGVHFKLVLNKAGEDDDDRWQITTTHGGVWVAQGKLVYGKRERVA